MFVPFSPAILGYALKNFERRGTSSYWLYPEGLYNSLGYDVDGKRAIYRQPPKATREVSIVIQRRPHPCRTDR
jgi:hypothetical protein